MKARNSLWAVAAAIALTGCGNSYDGIYAGGTGFLTVAVLTLDGSTGTVETVNTAMRKVVAKRELEAEIRSGNLHLTRADGLVFVYGLAADEESLECLSETCKGFGGLGKHSMPRTWTPHKDEG